MPSTIPLCVHVPVATMVPVDEFVHTAGTAFFECGRVTAVTPWQVSTVMESAGVQTISNHACSTLLQALNMRAELHTACAAVLAATPGVLFKHYATWLHLCIHVVCLAGLDPSGQVPMLSCAVCLQPAAVQQLYDYPMTTCMINVACVRSIIASFELHSWRVWKCTTVVSRCRALVQYRETAFRVRIVCFSYHPAALVHCINIAPIM